MNKSDTVAIIRSLLTSTKSSYTVCRLNADFKRETGFDIPLFGYGNLGDFLQSIPDTIRVSGMYPIQQVQLVENEKSAHIVSLVKRTKTESRNNNSKGHSRRTKITNGFWNRKIQSSSGSTEVSTDLEKGFKGIKISSTTISESNASSCSLMTSHSRVSLVGIFLNVEETIPPIDINQIAQLGRYVEICPKQIYNPHEFYFQFRKFKRQFANFMNNLQEYYEANENIPELTDEVIKPKLTCAVFHKIRNNPMWHRGEIKQLVKKSHVSVTFIDYGCRAVVSKGNLKPLHLHFTSLPKQAVLGSLANIRPSERESRWSSDAIKRFNVLACEKDLIAGVVAMDAEAYSMKVALTCTNGLEFHINDALVNEGYAEFCAEILKNHTEDKLEAPVHQENDSTATEPFPVKVKYTKEEVLKLLMNNPLAMVDIPSFYFSSAFPNKRLQKLLSATEGMK